jgi:parallel beta-helix repeat protein
MKRILLIIIIFLILILSNANNVSLQAREQSEPSKRIFYVSTNGNDQWSGTLHTPDSSAKDGPFATLQRARNAIRELRKGGSRDAFSVLVRGGVYELNETFTLDQEDSGTESHPTVFKAFSNEHPILIGSRRINNFEPYSGKIYKADLSGTAITLSSFRQLFSEGKRQILARYPNYDPYNPIGGGFLYVDNFVIEGNKRMFRFKEGSTRHWDHPEDSEIFIFPGNNWTSNILPVLEINNNDKTITLSKDATHDIMPGNRYYFQNIFEELDSPGEWYFDRRKKMLYYWPVNEASLRTVSVPILKSIVDIRGKKYLNKYKTEPAHIRIEGFTLEDCEWSAIVINGAKNIVIARCTIFNAGGYGVEINSGFRNTVIGNDIYDVGDKGIFISGGERTTLSPGENRVDNNYIHHVGVFSKTGSGIECRGVGNVVTNNLIHTTPRVGIWIEGNDHMIEYNHIHHVNEETQDSGAIYFGQTDWTKRGNVVQFNYIHDSGGYGRTTSGIWKTPFDTYGIYMDDWASGAKVYGNIVTNTASGGIFIHSGRDNIVENNMIIEGGTRQMVYSGWPPNHPVAKKFLPVMFAKIKEMGYTKYPLLSTITDIGTGAKMSGNKFIRNIIYYADESALLYLIYDIDLDTTISDYNVIYHAGLPLLVPYTNATANLQWRKWRDRGLDKNSIVADPLIDLSATGKFQLFPASPALKLGFKPIPFEKIGPYKNPLRASWPIKD